MTMQQQEEEQQQQEQPLKLVLPLGYKFRPSDQELLFHFLKNKLKDPTAFQPAAPIYDIRLYDHHPKLIIDQFGVQGPNNTPECYVFTMRHRKFLSWDRANRILKDNVGYWRASYSRDGEQFQERRRGGLVGERMNLVYYDTATTTTSTSDKKKGAKKGTKTEWLMNEYKIKPAADNKDDGAEEDLVLCKIYMNNRQKNKDNSNHHQQQYNNMQQELPYLQQQQQYIQQEQQPPEQPYMQQELQPPEQYMQQEQVEQPHLLLQQQQQPATTVDNQAAFNTGTTYRIDAEIDAHTFWDQLMSQAPEPQQTGMGMISIDDYAY